MRLWKMAVLLATAALTAGPMAAQPPRGGGGAGGLGGFGGIGGLSGMLAFNKQLQDELKMDKDQVDKLTEALDKIREEMRDSFSKLREASPEERTAILKKVMETNNKSVESVLKPEQLKRLHQIENQQAGVGMFSKDDVKTALKLTAEQKEKIESINSTLQKDTRELFAGGRDPQAARKQQALVREAMDSVMGVLDEEQRKTVKDLTGEPFDLRTAFGGARGQGAGFGGFAGAGMGMAVGQIMPTFLQDTLRLNAEQKKQVEELQKEIDAKLEKILTEEQNKQLKQIRERRPGGFGGPPRGPGGPGGPGGP